MIGEKIEVFICLSDCCDDYDRPRLYKNDWYTEADDTKVSFCPFCGQKPFLTPELSQEEKDMAEGFESAEEKSKILTYVKLLDKEITLSDLRRMARNLHGVEGDYVVEIPENRVENLPGYVPKKEYSRITPLYGEEYGACEIFRFVEP